MTSKSHPESNRTLLKLATIWPFATYGVLWCFTIFSLLNWIEHPFAWLRQPLETMWNTPWATIVVFLVIIFAARYVWNVFWKALIMVSKTVFSILFYPFTIPLLWIGKFFTKDKRVPRFEAWGCYKAFLKSYYQQRSYSGIFETHMRFLPFMIHEEFPKKWKDRAWLVCPFETWSKLVEIQNIIDDKGEDNEKTLLVRDFEMDDAFVSFSVNYESKSGKELRSHVKSKFDLIEQKLPWFNSGSRYFMKEHPNDEDIKDGRVEVVIKRKVQWEIRKFDFTSASASLKDGNLLLGFTPEGNGFEDIQIPLQSMLHSMIVAETWKGKDVTTRSYLWSILEGIRRWLPFELHLFDSKGDWLPFKNHEEFGIHLYEDVSEYPSITSKLVEDMRTMNGRIGMEADLGAYLKSHPGSEMKYRFIFINEFSSLYGLLEKKDQKTLHSNLNVLFSQSRSAGYRITLILQTARSKSENTIRELSLNIGTAIAGKIKDETEAGMISKQFRKHISSLQDHNFCLIKNGEYTEFRCYYSEKIDIDRWITDVFVPDMEKKWNGRKREMAEVTLQELSKDWAVMEFLEYARKDRKFLKEEAMNRFGLSEPIFRKLAASLVETHEIRFETGRGYFFREDGTEKDTVLDSWELRF